MKKTVFAWTFGLIAFAGEWTGYVSDAKCGRAHTDGSEKSVKCVTGCVKAGTAPVFVAGDKVLQLDDASKAKVMGHLGRKVTIQGSLKGETLSIASIAAAR